MSSKFYFAGMGCVFVGICMINPAIAIIFIGIILLFIHLLDNVSKKFYDSCVTKVNRHYHSRIKEVYVKMSLGGRIPEDDKQEIEEILRKLPSNVK